MSFVSPFDEPRVNPHGFGLTCPCGGYLQTAGDERVQLSNGAWSWRFWRCDGNVNNPEGLAAKHTWRRLEDGGWEEITT